MAPKIDVINLGMHDLEEARHFYEHGLGGAVHSEHEALAVSLTADSSRICLRPWDSLALDAGVDPGTHGFRSFTLSYILESPDEVDEVAARATRHGGRISKPPKGTFWGYAGYVTDPSGYLWKIASAKGRPPLRRTESGASNGHAVHPKEVPITIGVTDMKRAKQFYKEGIGLPVKKAFGNKFVMFGGQDGSSALGMYKREALAKDAAVTSEGSGFRGFSLTYAVDSPAAVDSLLIEAAEAGARVVRSPAGAGARRYFGYFSDPDGNLWQVASRTSPRQGGSK